MKHQTKLGHVLLKNGRLITDEEWHLGHGRKHKRRKGRYMKGYSHWAGQSQYTKRLAARKERRQKAARSL